MEFDPSKYRKASYDDTPVRSTLSAEIDQLKAALEVERGNSAHYRERYEYYRQKWVAEASNMGSGFGFFFGALIFTILAVLSHALRSDLTHNDQTAATAQARVEYLKTIVPISPSSADVASQCDAGKAFVGYRNGTGRALALVDFEVRGYLPNRVSNIVETRFEQIATNGKAITEPNARLDRIVQPGDSFSECVKLSIADAYEGHPDLSKASYKVKPIGFKFLEDYPGYVQDHTKSN